MTELLVAAGLFIPVTRKAALLGALILMGLFTIYIGYMILFTPHLPCSCGGVLKQMSWRQHFVFNIVFTLLAGAGYTLEKNTHRFIAINRSS